MSSVSVKEESNNWPLYDNVVAYLLVHFFLCFEIGPYNSFGAGMAGAIHLEVMITHQSTASPNSTSDR